MTIEAIPTEYDGVLFSSKLEARWALLFNLLQVEWAYEPRGASTAPDFGLYAQRFNYLEVKGGLPSRNCLAHMRRIGCELIAVGGFYRGYWPTILHVTKTGYKGMAMVSIFNDVTTRQLGSAFRKASTYRFDLRRS